MFIEFGDSLISISYIFGFKRCEKIGVLSEYYTIEMIFNHNNSDGWNCWEEFETKEEMEKRWNELKMMLCPITLNSYGAGYGYGPLKDIPEDFTAKLEKDSNPFFISIDLGNGKPV